MTAVIEIEDVSVSRDGAAVLRGLSLRLSPGERLAIVGSNGSGKTTLLRTLMGLEETQGGTVRLFGAACRHARDFEEPRRRIGYLFQDSDDQLFSPTVIEDVAFGPLNLGLSEADAFGRAEQILATLGIAALAPRVSHRLSGGEKRLVCLAGLLAMEPEVLLLDEPTNGVDAANGARLRAALQAFPGAMLLVSHDEAIIAALATRAMILEEGQLLPAQIVPEAHTHARARPLAPGA